MMPRRSNMLPPLPLLVCIVLVLAGVADVATAYVNVAPSVPMPTRASLTSRRGTTTAGILRRDARIVTGGDARATTTTGLRMVPPLATAMFEAAATASAASAGSAASELTSAAASSFSSSSPLFLAVAASASEASTEAWVAPVAAVLDPLLNFLSFAMICRVVISWYPTTNLNQFPFFIVTWPTELLLKSIRGVVPPAFGVDITPVVWFGLFTFLHEILVGQQGLFTMKIKYGI